MSVGASRSAQVGHQGRRWVAALGTRPLARLRAKNCTDARKAQALVGAILLSAAGLKSWVFMRSPKMPTGVLGPEPALIGWEIFLGLWLISGALPIAARRAAIGCFGVFGIYAFYEALAGKADCGCFGQVKVNPWFTVVLDVSIVLALLFLAKPAVKVFRKQQNLHFVSQNHPRRTYVLWKPLFAERSPGIGPDRVACGQNGS